MSTSRRSFAQGATGPDLDPRRRTVSGRRQKAEAIAKRLCTPAGSVFYDPDCGHDLRQYCSMRLAPGRLYAIGVAASAEAEKVDGIFAADVEAEMVGKSKLRVFGTLTDTAGPFEFELSIDALTVSILKPES